MPTLGRSRKRPVAPRIIATLLVLGVAVAGGVYLRARRVPPPTMAPSVTPVPGTAATAAPASGTTAPASGAAASGVAAASQGEDAGHEAPPAAPPPKSAGELELEKLGWKRLDVSVNGPLETAVVAKVGPELGPRLVQVLVRSLVWWLAVPQDLRRGDHLQALYEERAGEDPIVHIVRYQSEKMGRTFHAYRYKLPDGQFARFYTGEGQELEARLQHAPLDDYEQVTSLLRDGRGHKGVDFKTPMGSPVKAPFDATVVKKNWNFRGNGNSIELHESGGHGWTVMFLHLAEPPSLAVGAHVSRGELVGKSGNTGHSFAPHLHYQLMAGSKILDPFSVQETFHRKLPDGQKKAFAAEEQRLDHLLDAQ
jgi:murein DD-endopeptidase MepM/ murein hydrolase activator NlpD